MSSDKPESKHSSTGAAAPKAPQRSGKDRLAAALRDNLKRRKAQARARREPGPGRHDR
jgi:hypothetical protein